MANQQGTMQTVCTLDRIHLVTILILLRSTHIALGINRIIKTIAGRRSHSHTSLEHRATLAHTHQRIEATITPAPDADIILIYVWQTTHVESRLHLVLRLQIAQSEISRFLKFCTTATRSATINTNHDETLLSQIIVESTTLTHTARIPGIQNLLVARTGILEQDDRILLVGIKVNRLHHPTVEFHALGSSK